MNKLNEIFLCETAVDYRFAYIYKDVAERTAASHGLKLVERSGEWKDGTKTVRYYMVIED